MTTTVIALLAATSLPVFKGYEAPRYQQHDALIERLVREYNANPKLWTGSVDGQHVPERLEPALVKAHMIEETGGNDAVSRASWAIDPLQVNVPGDWNHYKTYLGLKKPRHRNEGSAETNIRAGIKYLSRKGYGRAGQPAGNRPEANFDGWDTALERYNGRMVKTADGKIYCEVYSSKIDKRKKNPTIYVPVEIPMKK